MEIAAAPDTPPPPVGARPAVSVVVPFAGDEAAGRATVAQLAPLRLGPDDELLLADNSPDATLARVQVPAEWTVVPAPGEGSPARARNAGALRASRDWILFLDSDVRPSPDLVDRLLERDLPDDVGLVAGGVLDAPEQTSLAARYARTRKVLDQKVPLAHDFLPYALTANLLVRRATWEALGGFLEGAFNGEDVDFCWRAQRRGWRLEAMLDATVEHLHRDSVKAICRQYQAQRASTWWVHRRWPDAPRPTVTWVRWLVRALVAAPIFAVAGRRDRARLKIVDARVALALGRGRWTANRAFERPRPPATRRPVQVWCDAFPVISETFVIEEARALAALGHAVEVVAARRPDTPRPGVFDVPARYLEDDSPWERLTATAWLVARHPLRCLRDRRERRRWAAEEAVPGLRFIAHAVRRLAREPHAIHHVHFAKGAALSGMRAARLLGRPWSLTAHAYDIYKDPSNLAEKVRDAALVTSGCDYTVADLREIAGPERAERVVRVIMGIDPEAFRRTTPYPGGRRVVAVGRLVEKKGFVHLVRAMADPSLAELGAELVIAGEGPLHAELAAEIAELGVAGRVRLAGRMTPDEIRGLLESADVLAMPCVVAADGDRDSMPVVVKEALSMEVPVVVSDEVGLPELVRPEFGRKVPPGDHVALASALAELLGLDAAARAAMGRAGRAFVAEHANVLRETERLSDQLERVALRGR